MYNCKIFSQLNIVFIILNDILFSLMNTLLKDKKVKVAITGSSGYLASVLLPLLNEDKQIEKIIGIDVIPPKNEAYKKLKKFEHITSSILDYDKLLEIFKKTDCVVHMVFNINGMHDKKKLEAINVTGSRNVIDATGEAGVKKLICTSSIAAYGAHKDNPVPLTETSPLRGKGTFFYAEQKQMLEEYLDDFEKKNPKIEVVRLRFCTTTGPKASNETVTLYTAPVFIAFPHFQPPVQLLHEDDAAKAFYFAVIKNVKGAFNIGSDWTMTAKEHARIGGAKIIYLPLWLSRTIAKLLWHLRLVKFDPSWISASLYPLVVETSKANKEMGWKANYNSRQIIESLSKRKKK
jgi:UDP-glucose 4-epimerase